MSRPSSVLWDPRSGHSLLGLLIKDEHVTWDLGALPQAVKTLPPALQKV